MRRSIVLSALALLASGLFALSSCDSSSSHSAAQGITEAGGLAADPIVAHAYVTDRHGRVLLTVDLRNGQTPHRREFDSELAGVAVSPCGRHIAVALPALNMLSVLELPTFFQRELIELPHSPAQLLWSDTHQVVVATDGGLLEVDTRSHQVRRIDELANEQCLMAHDTTHGRLFLLHDIDGELCVRCLSLEGPKESDRVTATATGQLQGRGIALQLSWHGDVLMVASDGGDGTYLLDSDTLETIGTAFSQEGLAAAAFNPTGTRMYQARGSSTVTGFNLGDFEADFEAFPLASVTERNLLMAGDGLSLVMHLSSGDIDLRRAFDLQLLANPVAPLSDQWELEVRGQPGATLRVLLAIEPGFIFLDPPKTPSRRFLDLDLSSLLQLTRVGLGEDGRAIVRFDVPADRSLEGARFILQAVSVADGKLVELSNPLVVTTSEVMCR